MSEMTSRERFTRMFEHREADRIPIIDHPWDATIARWQREGMPESVSYVDYFGLDKRYLIGVDNSPQYERRTVEETDEFVTTVTEWGTTLKNWKMEASTPQFLDFTIVDRNSWAEAKGIKAHLHSCGDINPFVPELVDMGLDGLNPLEVKAGMDPIHLKETFGDDLLLHGGINAVLWNDIDAITEEMRHVVPVVKENGGDIFSSDHSVPSSVSLENFRRIVELAKELGSY
jgi:uroporphyrinogen-III decarboxylase